MSWEVTITDSNGTDHTPQLVTTPSGRYPKRLPAADGRPQLQVAVPPEYTSNNEPKWFESRFEAASMDVVFDGTTQPIDELVGVQLVGAGGPVVLTGRGNPDLDQRIETSFQDAIETHTAANQVITNAGFSADTPTPATTTSSAVTVQSGSTTTELRDRLVDALPDDRPIQVTGGEVVLQQSLFLASPDVELTETGDFATATFTPQYDIPAEDVIVGVYLTKSDTDDLIDPTIGSQFTLDASPVGLIPPGQDQPPGSEWYRGAFNTGAPFDLEAGTSYTVSVEATQDTLGGLDLERATVDAIALYDDRYTYDWSDDQPPTHPDAQLVEFEDALITRAVTGGTIAVTMADSEPAQLLELSNDGGETWVSSAADVSSFDHDFADRGVTLRFRVELGRHGTDGQTADALQSFTLDADLETMPMTVNQRYDEPLAAVLDDLADAIRGEFHWEYDYVSGNTPSETIRFVRAGDRTGTGGETPLDVSVSQSTGGVLEQALVRGGKRSVSGEGWTADHGTAYPLDHSLLAPGSETVSDPETGTVYVRGRDYTMGYEVGEITAQSGGDLVDGERYAIGYTFKPNGEHTASGASTPYVHDTADIPVLDTDRACRLAARTLVEVVGTPDYAARVAIPANQTYSMVEALDQTALPTSIGELQLASVEAQPARTVLRFEGQEASFDDVLGDIENRFRAITRGV